MQKVKLFEQYVNEALIFDDGTTDIVQASAILKDALEKENPGYISLSKGVFGNDTIMLLVSFEPKTEWSNGYVENSNYFRMAIYKDGKMEVFTQSLYEPGKQVSYETRLKIKFRKATAKSMKDAADRAVKFVKEVKKALGK
jgi:hypothetical protein